MSGLWNDDRFSVPPGYGVCHLLVKDKNKKLKIISAYNPPRDEEWHFENKNDNPDIENNPYGYVSLSYPSIIAWTEKIDDRIPKIPKLSKGWVFLGELSVKY